MVARVSQEMITAMRLIEGADGVCVTPYEAAKTVGIAASTIYRSRLYKEHMAKSAANASRPDVAPSKRGARKGN